MMTAVQVSSEGDGAIRATPFVADETPWSPACSDSTSRVSVESETIALEAVVGEAVVLFIDLLVRSGLETVNWKCDSKPSFA